MILNNLMYIKLYVLYYSMFYENVELSIFVAAKVDINLTTCFYQQQPVSPIN